jgi:hypothetical protein
MSRWWLKRHPEFPDFFETRERSDDGYDHEQGSTPND